MGLPTRFRPPKTNANYPAHPAPGRKRFHAALNLLNSHLSQPRCGIVGHGLDNLVERLNALYGVGARLNVLRRDGYSVVEMVLPRT
jgi:hypothetical protein